MDFCHCLSAAGGWFYQHALAAQTTMERERLENRVELGGKNKKESEGKRKETGSEGCGGEGQYM